MSWSGLYATAFGGVFMTCRCLWRLLRSASCALFDLECVARFLGFACFASPHAQPVPTRFNVIQRRGKPWALCGFAHISMGGARGPFHLKSATQERTRRLIRTWTWAHDILNSPFPMMQAIRRIGIHTYRGDEGQKLIHARTCVGVGGSPSSASASCARGQVQPTAPQLPLPTRGLHGGGAGGGVPTQLVGALVAPETCCNPSESEPRSEHILVGVQPGPQCSPRPSGLTLGA